MAGSKPIVLDSSAVIAFINGEPGGDRVREIIITSHFRRLYFHRLNVCEVAYKLIRAGFSEKQAFGMAIMPDWFELSDRLDSGIWQRAVALKAQVRGLSLVDGVCIAFAEYLDADILTGDRQFREAGSSANILLFR